MRIFCNFVTGRGGGGGTPRPRKTPTKIPKTPEKIPEQEEEKSTTGTRDPSECVRANGEKMSSSRTVDEMMSVETGDQDPDTGERREEQQEREEPIICDSS